jgi:putative alpha-1,2-mannosidase
MFYDQLLDYRNSTTYEGLDGNDDGGTLSAWYIFSSMGFYPIAGSNIYQLGTPLFEEAEINMNGKILIIRSKNYTPGNFYVSKVWLNGILLNRSWIRHAEIADGGLLELEMTSTPNFY